MTDSLAPPRGSGKDAVLDVQGVQKIYTGRGRTVEAVRDLTFSVGQNELVCIVGPSGAGKTTLLKIIAGLLDPTTGQVILDGQKVTRPPESMAVVFQEYGRSLYPWYSIEHNVELPLQQKKLPKARRKELVHEALDAVGLGDVHHAFPWQLSGGMQQRVAIARAVAYQPKVLLMDEPFAAVDAQTRADLEDLVRSLWHRYGTTILFVTHDIDESVYLGQRVLVLSSSPTVVMEDLPIDLPDERSQLETRSGRRFAELRHHIYEQIQLAKRRTGSDSPTESPTPETSAEVTPSAGSHSASSAATAGGSDT